MTEMSMYPQFPIIRTLADILPHIEGREEFQIAYKGDYTVVNYMVAFEDTFKWDPMDPVGSAIRRECRGLIFKEGSLVSRPYHKFFNVGEKEETQTDRVNLYEPHVVLEKLDGSMIRPLPTGDGFRLATKAGITEVAENAERFIADKPEYAEFITFSLSRGYTPVFEWCSRQNRIVVDYPEDQLILTAIRYVESGDYMGYGMMARVADAYGIPVVKAVRSLPTQNINLFVNQVKEWEDEEGVIIRFDDGRMVKVKADDYVLRHKTKESINLEKNVIKVIIEDGVDDILPMLSESDAKRLEDFQKAFWLSINDVASDIYDTYTSLNKGTNQKDFAIEVQNKVPRRLHSFMFAAHQGAPLKDYLIAQIGKSLNTQTKVDGGRWMWGDLRW